MHASLRQLAARLAVASAGLLVLSCSERPTDPGDGASAATAARRIKRLALARIGVTPETCTVHAGGTVTFTATSTDAYGNLLAITPTWSVVAGGGAISAAGVFTAGAVAGTFANTVQATSGGVGGRATVTVTASPGTAFAAPDILANWGFEGSTDVAASGPFVTGNGLPFIGKGSRPGSATRPRSTTGRSRCARTTR